MARRMFETFGPRLGITEDENDFACKRGLEGARHRSTRTSQEKGRAILETVEAEDRVAILHDRPPVPLRPGPQPRHPRGVPGPRATRSSVGALDPARIASTSIATTRRTSRRAASRARSSSTTCGRRTTRSTARRRSGRRASRRATRTSSCSTCRPSSAATTRRPTASSTDHRDEQDAVRRAARHRRQQAGRHHQDPRQDLRPRPQAPRGAPAGRGASASASSSTRIDQKRLELLSSARSSSPRATSSDPGDRARQLEELRERVARLRSARRAEPEAAQGPRPARQEDRRTAASFACIARATANPDPRRTRGNDRPTQTVMATIVKDKKSLAGRRHRRGAREVRGGGAQAPRPRRRRPSTGSRTWRT